MIDSLEECRLFTGCSKEELADIGNICQRIAFKKGHHLFEAGSPAEYLFIVIGGAIELRFKVTHYNAPQELTIDRILKGEAFGWSALSEPNIYTLSGLSTTDSELLQVKANDIMKLCKENYHLGYILMKNIAAIVGERFATMQKILIDVIQQHLIKKEG